MKTLAVDTETTGLVPWEPHRNRPWAFSFCDDEGVVEYYEFPVDPYSRKVVYSSTRQDKKNFRRVQTLLAGRSRKVFHNADFDVRMCEYAGLKVLDERGRRLIHGGKFDDTLLMAHACNNQELSHQLKPLAKKYLGVTDDDQKDLKDATNRLRRIAKKVGWNTGWSEATQPDGSIKKKAEPETDYWLGSTMLRNDTGLFTEEQLEEAEVGAEAAQRYAEIDAERTMLLYSMYRNVFKEEVEDDSRSPEDMYRKEIKLWLVLYRMIERGVVYDRSVGMSEQVVHAKVWKETLEELRDLAEDDEFNPRSSPQLGNFLFDKMGLEPGRYTDSGKPSTNKESLELMLNEPVVQLVFKHRSAGMAYSTFLDKYNRLAGPDRIGGTDTEVLHPGFRQVGTDTGRLSCSNPNLQQVSDPTKSASVVKMKLRHTLKPRPGYGILSPDYSNQEMRIFAHAAQDELILKAFREGRDVHGEMTNMIWGKPGSELAVRYMSKSLQLFGNQSQNPKEELVQAWKDLGVSRKLISKGLSPADRAKIASTWLEQFDWKISEAESAVGTKNTRGVCKQCSFLKLFGGGKNRLAGLLNIPLTEATEILADYDREIPTVKEFSDKLIDEAKTNGYVWSAFGRRLSLDVGFEYRAVNHYVQGSAADMMKMAMVRLDDYFREGGYDAHLLLQVHDELVMELKRGFCTSLKFIRKVCELMGEHDGVLSLDMPVEPALSYKSWQDVKPIKRLEVTA